MLRFYVFAPWPRQPIEDGWLWSSQHFNGKLNQIRFYQGLSAGSYVTLCTLIWMNFKTQTTTAFSLLQKISLYWTQQRYNGFGNLSNITILWVYPFFHFGFFDNYFWNGFIVLCLHSSFFVSFLCFSCMMTTHIFFCRWKRIEYFIFMQHGPWFVVKKNVDYNQHSSFLLSFDNYQGEIILTKHLMWSAPVVWWYFLAQKWTLFTKQPFSNSVTSAISSLVISGSIMYWLAPSFS